MSLEKKFSNSVIFVLFRICTVTFVFILKRKSISRKLKYSFFQMKLQNISVLRNSEPDIQCESKDRDKEGLFTSFYMLLHCLTSYKNSNYEYGGKDSVCVLDSGKI